VFQFGKLQVVFFFFFEDEIVQNLKIYGKYYYCQKFIHSFFTVRSELEKCVIHQCKEERSQQDVLHTLNLYLKVSI